MEYFFLSLCVVAFWIGGSSGEGPYKVEQDPNPVRAGGTVNVTCSAEYNGTDLAWKIPGDDNPVIDWNTAGIDNIIEYHNLRDNTVSSTLININLMSDFSKTVSCGKLSDNSTPWQEYTICESWNIIGDITVSKGAVEPKTMTCAVEVGKCTKPSNPWFYKDGEPVLDDLARGISVTNESIGLGGVVQWKLKFTNLSRSDVFGTYTCDVLGTSTATVVFTTTATNQATAPGQVTTSQNGASDTSSTTLSVSTTALSSSEDTTSTASSSSTTPPDAISSGTAVLSTSLPGNVSSTAPVITPTPTSATTPPTIPPAGKHNGMLAMAVAVMVLMVICGAVSFVYWKRHMLRDWLMDKDVVKVIKKQRRGKGYKYSKLPRDITTSMKHLE